VGVADVLDEALRLLAGPAQPVAPSRPAVR
jgi:hypothetical protein